MKKIFLLLMLLTMSVAADAKTVNFYNNPNSVGTTVISLGCTLILTAGCVVLIWLLLHFRRQQHLDKLNIVNKSLELDRPLPKEFFYSGYKPTYRNFSNGIFWIGAGLAVIVFFAILGAPVWPIGIILVGLGLSKIAGYIIATQESEKN